MLYSNEIWGHQCLIGMIFCVFIVCSSLSFVFLLSLHRFLIVWMTDNFCLPKHVYQLLSWHCINESVASFSIHFRSAIFYHNCRDFFFLFIFTFQIGSLMEINLEKAKKVLICTRRV